MTRRYKLLAIFSLLPEYVLCYSVSLLTAMEDIRIRRVLPSQWNVPDGIEANM